ncbi:MAG TPA: PIN domain-containing protein [Candidatus Acidoferrales bacterium]|nr:PIN domain-containing protein [Candidatus Acidoferrales bacterium]
MNVLIDTSVWSLALRRKPHDLGSDERTVVAELAELIGEGRARIIGLVRQELLSGIKAPAQFEKLRAALIPFPDEPVDTADYEAAARAGNDCRAKGVIVSVVEILICAIALNRGWHIFTTDPDFRNYARVLPIRLHTRRV